MDLVVIRTFDNYFTANIMLTKLRDAGVQCYLKDEYTVTIDPLLSNAIGGIKLIVRNDDIAYALQIISGFDSEYRNAVQCPHCGSHDIILVPKGGIENVLKALSTWLFSSYAISAENVYKCNQCGFQCEDLPETPSALSN